MSINKSTNGETNIDSTICKSISSKTTFTLSTCNCIADSIYRKVNKAIYLTHPAATATKKESPHAA